MVKEFFKRLFLAEPTIEERTIIIKNPTPIGTTGTQNYAGYTAEEYLSSLSNSRVRADKFDQMRRSDPQVKMVLNAVKAPLKGAKWDVEPYKSDDPEMEKDAELVEYILFEGMKKTFAQFLTEAMTLVDFGHSVFEIIDKIETHPEFGTIVSIKDLSFRSQRTIEKWNLDKKTNELISISQCANGDLSSSVDIPSEFLLLFSLEREGSNYEGISALRCIYGNWFRKNFYLKMNAIGIERFAIPTPIATVPPSKEGGAEFTNMQAALEAFTGHEKAYLTVPDGWKIELHSNTYDPQKVETSIDNEDKRMVKAFLANFLELGINGSGSQSLSVDLSDFFLNSIEHIGQLICEEINQKLIPRIIKLNRGERAGYPQLKFSGISDKVGIEFTQALKNLYDSKIVVPDDKLEEHIREMFKLPEKSEDGQRVNEGPAAPFGKPEKEEKEIEPANPLLHEKLKKIYG